MTCINTKREEKKAQSNSKEISMKLKYKVLPTELVFCQTSLYRLTDTELQEEIEGQRIPENCPIKFSYSNMELANSKNT